MNVKSAKPKPIFNILFLSLAGLFFGSRLLFAFWEILFDFSSPILNHDFVMYFARGLRAREFYEAAGRLWGYDPFEMAGYLSGPVHEVGSMLLAHPIAWLGGMINPGVLFNLTIFTGFLLIPFFIFAASSALGRERKEALLAAGLVCFTFGAADPITPEIWTRGIFGFLVGAFLAILQVGLTAKFCEKPSWKTWSLMTAVSALMIWCHPLTSLLVLLPNIVSLALVLSKKHSGLKVLGGCSLGLILGGLANAYWIIPYLEFSPDWQLGVRNFTTHGFQQVWYFFNPFTWSPLHMANRLFWLIIHYFAFKDVEAMVQKRPVLGWAAASAWLAAFVLSFFGSQIPILDTLQPGRNLIFYVTLVLVLGGPSFLNRLSRLEKPLAVIPIFAALCFAWAVRTPDRFTNKLPEVQEAIVAYIKTIDSQDGRILVESNEEDAPILNEILPQMSDGIFLGGGNPGNILKTNFTLLKASYYDRELIYDKPIFFGKVLSGMEESEIRDWLRLYNVKAVLAKNPTLVSELRDRDAVFEEERKIGFSVFVPRDFNSNWFVEGGGRLKWDYDRITVFNPVGNNLVIKAHWLKTLQTEGEGTAGPFELEGVPVPFIQVSEIPPGTKRIEITNRGLDPFWKKG